MWYRCLDNHITWPLLHENVFPGKLKGAVWAWSTGLTHYSWTGHNANGCLICIHCSPLGHWHWPCRGKSWFSHSATLLDIESKMPIRNVRNISNFELTNHTHTTSSRVNYGLPIGNILEKINHIHGTWKYCQWWQKKVGIDNNGWCPRVLLIIALYILDFKWLKYKTV